MLVGDDVNARWESNWSYVPAEKRKISEPAKLQMKRHGYVYGLWFSEESPGSGPSTAFAVEPVHANIRQSTLAAPPPSLIRVWGCYFRSSILSNLCRTISSQYWSDAELNWTESSAFSSQVA